MITETRCEEARLYYDFWSLLAEVYGLTIAILINSNRMTREAETHRERISKIQYTSKSILSRTNKQI